MPEHTLYMNAASAPCRAVLLHHHLVRDAFGPLECVPVDLSAQEHDPAFVRSNPLHTVPTLVTPWGALWESRAIMRYIEAMLPEPRLYPTGVYARAVIDRLLDWDLGTLYRAVSTIVYPWIFGGGVEPAAHDIDKLLAALRFLDREQLGDGRPYLCGPNLSIADISIAMTLSMLRLVDLDQLDELPHLTAWQQRLTELDGYVDIDLPLQRWVEEIHAMPQRPIEQLELDKDAFLAMAQQDASVTTDPASAIDDCPQPSALDRAIIDIANISGVAEGERNSATQLVACIGYDYNIDRQIWTAEVLVWNERSNTPPLPREEVESIVRQSYEAKRKLYDAGSTSPPDANGRKLYEDAPPP